MYLPTFMVCPERSKRPSHGRLLVVSNRLPVTLSEKDGHWVARPSAGGLATGISSYLKCRKSRPSPVLVDSTQVVGSLVMRQIWTDPDEEEVRSLVDEAVFLCLDLLGTEQAALLADESGES